MSKMDWVPCARWGERVSVPSGSQFDSALMQPGLATDADVEGRFEETSGRYFVHRIVGVVSQDWSATPSGPLSGVIHECIWPGLIDDPSIGGVIGPGFIDEAAGANARLWWRRTKHNSSVSAFADLNATSNRWFAHIDITPKQVIDDGQVPLYSILNTDDTTAALDFYLWLRLLLTPLD